MATDPTNNPHPVADDYRVRAARVIFAEVRERKGIYVQADARAVGLETMLGMVLEAIDESARP